MEEEPPYARIAAEIRRRIAAGELRPGGRVPSTRQITQEWGVAMATATRALAALRQDGLVQAVRGVGTVVAAPRPTSPPRTRAPTTSAPTTNPPSTSADPELGLTRERVVRAAIRIADDEGMPALSMRRVATDLGVATMTLYRHVPGKDDLVLLMADAVLADDPLPAVPPPGWRAQLELLARRQWAGYQRHPWLAPAISMTRPQLLPNGMAHTEWAMRAVDGLGLDLNAILHVAVSLINYVRGTAVNIEPEHQARQDTGITDDEWIEEQSPAMAEILATGAFPTLARLIAEPEAALDLETLFEFGLRRMLDGLAVLLESPSNIR